MRRDIVSLVAIMFLTGVTVAALVTGCSVKYSFTGAQIPIEAQTFSVGYFQNDAPMVAPTLSNDLTEALKDRFIRQTRLEQINEGGDIAFEGRITNYTWAPAGISADEVAETMRLTVTVRVTYVSEYSPEWSFEQGQEFSAFADDATSTVLAEVEGALLPQIIEELVDKIFNASVANW